MKSKMVNLSSFFLIIVLSVSVLTILILNDVFALDLEVRDKQGGLVYSDQASTRHPFELGVWAIPVFLVNIIFMILLFLHRKNIFPIIVENSIKFIQEFEVSRKIAVITVISLLIIFISIHLNEIEHSKEEAWGDYPGAVEGAKNFDVKDFNIISTYLKYFLLSISVNFLGNIRIIPLIVSITLLILTYFFVNQITKKRLAGLVSMTILMQSNLFSNYSVTATYENSWVLFYLLSLYLINKRWYLSPISYVLSLLSKPLTAIFLPMTLFFIYRSNMTKKAFRYSLIVYSIICFVIASKIFRGDSYIGHIGYHAREFLTGFNSFSIYMRSDYIIMLFLIPLVICLYFASSRGMLHADSVMMLISGIIWSTPLLSGFTDITNQPYRFVPLVVFFAIGVGTLFSNRREVLTSSVITKITFILTLVTIITSNFFVVFPSAIPYYYRV